MVSVHDEMRRISLYDLRKFKMEQFSFCIAIGVTGFGLRVGFRLYSIEAAKNTTPIYLGSRLNL